MILGMNWLELNCVHINCFDNIVMFPEFEEEEGFRIMYVNQFEESFKDDAQVFIRFYSLKVEREVMIVDLPVVCEFPNMLPYDIIDLPP